jgi:sigma-B regulation protein RsbU (phosphoserine phosphatase)
MTDVRAYLRALVLSNRNLEDIMVQARHLLVEDLGSDRFITLLFAQLNPQTGALDHINAGHPTGYVMTPEGHVREELVATAPALGIDAENERLVPLRVVLQKGDLVLLLTDGILETASPSGEEFGVSRALELVKGSRHLPSAQIIQLLFDEVRRFSGTNTLQDDITTVVIKCQNENRCIPT